MAQTSARLWTAGFSRFHLPSHFVVTHRFDQPFLASHWKPRFLTCFHLPSHSVYLFLTHTHLIPPPPFDPRPGAPREAMESLLARLVLKPQQLRRLAEANARVSGNPTNVRVFVVVFFSPGHRFFLFLVYSCFFFWGTVFVPSSFFLRGTRKLIEAGHVPTKQGFEKPGNLLKGLQHGLVETKPSGLRY